MSLSSVKSETALRSRLFSSSLGLQPAELLAPPIIRHLANPDLADCVHHVLALRDRNIDLPQLRAISSCLYRFLAIAVLLNVKDIKTSRLSTRQAFVAGTSMGVDHSVTMRANRKCRRKDLSRRKIPRFNLRLNAPSGFPLKIASIKTEAVLGKRGNAGFSGKSRAASVEIVSTNNPTGFRSGAGCQ